MSGYIKLPVTPSSTVPETRGGTNQTSYTTGDTLYASAANTLSRLAIGNEEEGLAVSSSGVPYWRDVFDPGTFSWFYDDFLSNSGTGETSWGASSSGAGAAVSLATSTSAHPGITQFNTGTTTTGRNALLKNANGVLLGGGRIVLDMIMSVPTLSTAAEEFAWRAGLGTVVTGDHTNGAYVEYDRATSGDFWVLKTAKASARTSKVLDGTAGNPTLAVVAGDWVHWRVVCNAAATQIDYYAGVNGAALTLRGSITTNIPIATCGHILALIKSAGTTSRTTQIDAYRSFQKLTSYR